MAASWRSNLKSPGRRPSPSLAPTLPSPTERLSKRSPRQDLKLVSPREDNTVKSRWTHLASSSRSKSPRKETSSPTKDKTRITADELIARKFAPEKKPLTRQRSQGFLKAVQKFEGEIPGKLLKQEEVEGNLANEQLEFCSNELIDMRKFIEQIEMDFSAIRQRIEKAREGVSDLRRSSRSFVGNG